MNAFAANDERDAGDHADRLVIHDLSRTHEPEGDEAARETDFAVDVRRGLTDLRKHLAPKYFYDDLGSLLFDAICFTPEYYPTRAEDEILRLHAGEIIARAAGDQPQTKLSLLELGGGSGEKTRRLIEAVLLRQDVLGFRFVDISAAALTRAARILLQTYPRLRIDAYAADYDTALDVIAGESSHNVEANDDKTRTLTVFLGSNIGNFDLAEAAAFLRRLRNVLRAGDALLIGADLRPNARKTRAQLVAAYDDAVGVTAAFNRNVLARINRELDADFDPRSFRHIALYDDAAGRMEMHLESTHAQTIRIAALNLEIRFEAGERIHTESSHKYDEGALDTLAAAADFCREQTWTDTGERFSSNLFRAC